MSNMKTRSDSQCIAEEYALAPGSAQAEEGTHSLLSGEVHRRCLEVAQGSRQPLWGGT